MKPIGSRLLRSLGIATVEDVNEARGALEARTSELEEAKEEIVRQGGLLDYAADALRMAGYRGVAEGLLDTGMELDANLPGFQAQRFYRSISSQSILKKGVIESRDLDDGQRQRILRASHIAYALQGQGENLIDILLDFMIGDEIRPRAKDENSKLQDFLDEIWEDPRSRLDEDHESLTRSLILEGELVQRADLSQIDGHLETGWADPIGVQRVIKDPLGRDSFVEVSGETPGETLLWFVLDSLTGQIDILPWPADRPNEAGYRWMIRETAMNASGDSEVSKEHGAHGLCFAWHWNRVKGATRGRGELTAVLDHIDAYDELIWSTVDVQTLKRLLLLHVKSPSIKTPQEGRNYLKDIGLLTPPRNPKTFATGDKVEITPIATQQADSERWLAQELGISIYGSKGLPGDWRGSQSDSNLAGARASEFLPLRRLRRKQKRLLRFWRRRVEVEIETRRRAGIPVPEGAWEMTTMEVGGKDQQRQAEVLKSLAAAMVQALSVDAIRPELANAVMIEAIKDCGIEIPKGADGLPEELTSAMGDIGATLRQLLSRKSRTDDGNQDEIDRDRTEEGAA